MPLAPEDLSQTLAGYDLGPITSIRPLRGGSTTAVLRVNAARGSFVAKPAGRLADVELQAEVARRLTDRGVRQPRVLPARSGALVSATGCYLQEFLPGAIEERPSERQVAAVMRHLGAYHLALADPATTGWQPDAGSLWNRVADPGYLLAELPALLARYDLAGRDEATALRVLGDAAAALAALPRQIVHGDIGPDNVLMAGDRVVAIVDFTPYCESVLFGACTALYWYHLHGHAGGLRRSVTALGGARPWSDAETSLWPASLVREALRRLATPLALAAESGGEPAASVGPRRAALAAAVGMLP